MSGSHTTTMHLRSHNKTTGPSSSQTTTPIPSPPGGLNSTIPLQTNAKSTTPAPPGEQSDQQVHSGNTTTTPTPPGDQQVYHCVDCSATFHQSSALIIHMRMHRKEKPYKCIICQRRMKTRAYLNIHLQTHAELHRAKHSAESPRKSAVSARMIAQSNIAQSPLEAKLARQCKLSSPPNRGGKFHTCKNCNASFSNIKALKAHELTHVSDKLQKCPQNSCGLVFRNKLTLKAHMKSHGLNHDDLECRICKQIFPSKELLKVHLNVHDMGKYTQKPKYKHPQRSGKVHPEGNESGGSKGKHGDSLVCSVCKQKFSKAVYLQIHLANHKCPKQKDSSSSGKADPEERGQTGKGSPESLSCSHCKQKFSKPVYLDIHLANHKCPKQQKCGVCSFKCATRKELLEHVKQHNQEEIYETCQVRLSMNCARPARRTPFKMRYPLKSPIDSDKSLKSPSDRDTTSKSPVKSAKKFHFKMRHPLKTASDPLGDQRDFYQYRMMDKFLDSENYDHLDLIFKTNRETRKRIKSGAHSYENLSVFKSPKKSK